MTDTAACIEYLTTHAGTVDGEERELVEACVALIVSRERARELADRIMYLSQRPSAREDDIHKLHRLLAGGVER